MRENRNLLNNTVESEEIEKYSGGIRNTVFGTTPQLTKHPLVFLDGAVRPMDDSSHRVGNARIADLTGVLFHYKFVDEHFHGSIAQAVREEHRINNSAKYKMYKSVLDERPSLQLKLETAREFEDLDDLLENQFLVVSEDYLSWVNAQEEKRVLQAAPQDESRGLAEAFLESRRQERAKILNSQRLERQLREENQRLTEENRRLAENQQRLMRRVHNMERQLQGIQSSRVWRLATALHRVKTRVLGRGGDRLEPGAGYGETEKARP